MKSKRVVVITGASAGVGRAVVRQFAKQKASLALIARGIEGLEGARREAESLGCPTRIYAIDVSDAEKVEATAAQIERELGPIDVWVNNAMVSVFSPVKEMTAEDYRRVTEVTYLGYVHGTLAALKRMSARNRGVIIQVGSALAYRAIPLQSAYCAAKHAINGFTESLRCELLHDRSRVKVVQVHLPALNTPQFSWVKSRLPNDPQPVPPIFQPEVAARAIAWAVDHPRREIWVGGPTFKAILADKFFPGIADRVLARMGYSSQQTSRPVAPGRTDNLWAPVAEDRGAHGSFDREAKRFSAELFLRMNFGALAILGAVGAAWWHNRRYAHARKDLRLHRERTRPRAPGPQADARADAQARAASH